MEFSENLKQFFETYDEPILFLESDHGEINEDLYSDKESESISNENTESKNSNKSFTIAVKDFVDQLLKCCKYEKNC
ncbi:36096_t:CDS:1, partial [Racocetra persica]